MDIISSLSKSHALVFLLEGSVKLIPSGCVNVYVALKFAPVYAKKRSLNKGNNNIFN